MPPTTPQQNPVPPNPTPVPAAPPQPAVQRPIPPAPSAPAAPVFLPAHQQPGIMTPPQTMQPYVPTTGPVVLPSGPKSERKKKIKLAAIVTAVILLIVALGVGVSRLTGKSGYKYTEFTEATLGEFPGRQMSFVYPKEMTEESKSITNAAYSHQIDEKGAKKLASTLAISTLYLGPIQQATIDAYKEMLVNKKDGYEEFIGISKQQAAKVNMEKMAFQNFTEYTNQNISKAYVADFTFSVKGSNAQGHGRQIIIMGKEQIYVVGFAADNAIWSSNKAALDTLINSIKIDL